LFITVKAKSAGAVATATLASSTLLLLQATNNVVASKG
jgi:hypothetical protein